MNKFEEAAKKRAAEIKQERNKLRDEAFNYVENFKKENGNKSIITLRIRDGYIGKELDKTGRKLQTERTAPRGTLVAIKGEEFGQIKIGYVYKSNKDTDIPIVGVAEALKYALNEEDPLKISKPLKEKDKELYGFFSIRARCYFWPEIYSYTRGTDKLVYPNYDKIHENRKRVLGEDA